MHHWILLKIENLVFQFVFSIGQNRALKKAIKFKYKKCIEKYMETNDLKFKEHPLKNRNHQNSLQKQPQELFCKKGVLITFVKLIEKHLCLRIFLNKVARLRFETLLKMKLHHRCFRKNFRENVRTPILKNISGRLLSLLAFYYLTSVEQNNLKLWFIFLIVGRTVKRPLL